MVCTCIERVWLKKKKTSMRYTYEKGSKKLDRKDADCLTQCVAKYFQMHDLDVPFFITNKNWIASLKRFFARRGLRIDPERYHHTRLWDPGRLYLVQGLSWRKGKNLEHCVLYRGGKKYWDPHISGKFLKGRPKWVWVVTKK